MFWGLPGWIDIVLIQGSPSPRAVRLVRTIRFRCPGRAVRALRILRRSVTLRMLRSPHTPCAAFAACAVSTTHGIFLGYASLCAPCGPLTRSRWPLRTSSSFGFKKARTSAKKKGRCSMGRKGEGAEVKSPKISYGTALPSVEIKTIGACSRTSVRSFGRLSSS